jgi:cyclic pyranopterin phosphate synthase
LRRDRFLTITHRDRLEDVLAGASAASAAGLGPIKINAVLLRGINDDEAPDLLRWALGAGYQLRFIEQMPLDAQGAWDRSVMITAEEILDKLGREFELRPHDTDARGAAPAETWRVTDGEHSGVVGIIASVTRPFCGTCDRARLTADGQIRDCLFATAETDLRQMLRDGATDEQLADVWRAAMWGKRAGHGMDDPGFLRPSRPMSAIGG